MYRLDLDGLRGVAIALVVVFHIWFGRVSGGVDVFLVLSGFFFTGMLLRRADSADSVGVTFTVRRTVRRLLPAMVVVLAAVVAAAIILRPYTQWSDFAAQTLASVFYYQNWYLAFSAADYLAADPSVSPLQHLWSMSVQGQFYLTVLLLIATIAWACRRWGRPNDLRPIMSGVIIAVAIASFVYATIGVTTDQGWNYYDSFAHAWELLAGAMLAILAPRISLPNIVRLLLASFGVAAVLLCGILIDGGSLFPGPAALFPVSAAIALIIAGANLPPAARPLPSRILATRAAVLLGDVSYPLYLWHWPMLIFFLSESGRSDAGLYGGLAVILASLVLAWITHRAIEQPLRMRNPTKKTARASRTYRRIAGALVSITAAGAIGSTVVWQTIVSTQAAQPVVALDPVLYPGAEAFVSDIPTPFAPMRPSIWDAPSALPYPTVDGCIADWHTREVVTCVYGDPSADRTIAVVGSSHAEHWVPALQILAEQHHFRIVVYLKMACQLTVDPDSTYLNKPSPDCYDWSADVLDRLAAEQPEWVFSIGTRPRPQGGDETPPEYLDVWTALTERDLNVIALRDTPWLRRDGKRYEAIDCLAQRGSRASCGMPRSEALDPINPAAAPAAAFPNVIPIDLTDAVCGPQICPVVQGNVLIYHDAHHLTANYSRSLAPALGRALGPVVGWW